jgi:hypothetical protein
MLFYAAFSLVFACWLMQPEKESEGDKTEGDKMKGRKRPAKRALKKEKSSDSESNEDSDSDSDCGSIEHSSDDEEEDCKKQKTSTSKSKKIAKKIHAKKKPASVWTELWINLNSKMKMCDVPGDGNCLFSAIELSNLTLENKTAKKQKFFDVNSLDKAAARLRKRVINYMKENADEIKPFIQDDETLEEHLKKMKKKTCWGEEVHVHVVTKLFEKPVFVYTQSNSVIAVAHRYGDEFHKVDQSGDNVIRIFHQPEHYQAIDQTP